MLRHVKLPLFLAACLLSSTSAFADPILGLFNTGVDASGNPLSGGAGVTDPHYTILSGPGTNIYPLNAVTFNCCYFADQPSGTNGNSRWISVNANGSNANSGSYDFETTFSLTGLDPSTASITGRFAADNHITATEINGNVVAGATTDTFGSYTTFSITSGFVAGLNKLDFRVLDDGQPMSLRVDGLIGTASPQGGGGTVPEPATLALLGIAFAGMGLGKRRKLN
jgi:hypothetical protein